MKRHYKILYLLISLNTYFVLSPVIARTDSLTRAIRSKYGCGCAGISFPSNTGYVTPNPIIHSSSVWSFVSAPNLHPMKIKVNTNLPGIAPGFIFVAPYAFSQNPMYGQSGALITDNDGNPIWFRPLDSPNLMNTDFRVQKLNGKQVLTFWQGTLATPPSYTNVPAGSSEPDSCYYIFDNTYRLIKNIAAQKNYTSDIHEFLLTPQNTALLLSTKAIKMDLTPFGGPKNGYVQDFAVQEIDIKTNNLIFFWNALDHISLTDSYEPASSATSSNNIWDAFHLNSISLTDNENEILISGRNTWTIYKVHKPTKKIIWRLGGKQSDFTFANGTTFSWQHDARFLPNNLISLFDDNCCESSTIPPGTPNAHGLIVKLDFKNMTANFDRSYFHNPNLQVGSQGNLQSLPNTNKFIGWGQSQYFSEYKKAGNTVADPSLNTLYDAQMPGNNYTYRAYRHQWIGKPFYSPSIAVKTNGGQITVYASWNGSTQTASWEVFAGNNPNNLMKIKTVNKTGFETAIIVNNNGPFFKVKALNSKGNVIGESNVINN